MSPTVQKTLSHGPVIIEHTPLPIVILLKEAAEEHYKDTRQFREYFPRKSSWVQYNTDIINKFSLRSQHYLNCHKKTKAKNQHLSAKVF